MHITCRPQEAFPEEFRAERTYSNPFRAGFRDTLLLMERELDYLGATFAVIELALREEDLRIDGWPRAAARPSHPGVVVSFDSRHGDLRYGTDRFPTWQANLRAIALGLEALRKVERYGIGKRGEQYVGWRQLEAGGMTPSEARRLLDEYGGEVAALKASHPDHGGSSEAFQEVQEARKVLGHA